MWPFSNSSSTSQDRPSDRIACPIAEGEEGRARGRLDNSSPRLATDRVISSIPRYRAEPNPADNNNNQPTNMTQQAAPSACPVDHSTPQAEVTADQQNWVYPSPSQFYQALKRKNRNPRADDMYTVVPIHNAVNERVWTQVLEWEAYYGKGAFDRWPRSGKSGPMLCSFRGRPNDLSPRAWIKVMSGYQAPFDRHDWEVIRPTEQRMRYVVDFYAGRGAANIDQGGGGPNLAFYLDVRPALDSWEGVRMRFLRATRRLVDSFTSLYPSSSGPTRPDPSQDPQKKS